MFATIAAALIITGSLLAQTSDTSTGNTTSKDTKPKAKRVWTEDDLKTLHGPISVVGSAPSTPAKPKADDKSGAGNTQKNAALPQSTRSTEECVSEDWAAGIVAMAQAQGVDYDANYWSMRVFGGACLTTVSPQDVAGRLTGDYVLDSGAKVHIKAEAFSPLPSATAMVVSMSENKPLMISWKGGAYLLTFFDYVDQTIVGGDGSRTHIYYSSKLTLTGPRSGRTVVFDVAKGSPSELQGAVMITVTSRQ